MRREREKQTKVVQSIESTRREGGDGVRVKLKKYLLINREMNIKCTSLPKERISINNDFLIDKIRNGAVAIIKLYQDCEHYCLLTHLEDNYAYLFDPYYLNINYYDNDKDIEIIKDKPFEYNRKVTKFRMDSESKKDFSIIKGKEGMIIIIEKL